MGCLGYNADCIICEDMGMRDRLQNNRDALAIHDLYNRGMQGIRPSVSVFKRLKEQVRQQDEQIMELQHEMEGIKTANREITEYCTRVLGSLKTITRIPIKRVA